MQTALVYRRRLLPYSETFIKDQITACRSWRCILVGGYLVDGLDLDGLEIHLLAKAGSAFARRLMDLRLRLGFPPHLAVLRRDRPRLVHAHFGTEGVDAAAIAQALGVPLLITLHGYDINIRKEYWERGNGGRLMRRYPQRLLRLAERPDVHFVAVSDSIRRRALEWGIADSKISLCHIGVDTDKFTPGPIPLQKRARRVLFCGRLVEKKGCEFLLRALAQIQSQVPDIEVAIAGDGPLRVDLERLALELNLPAAFLGRLPVAAVKEEMARARVFCLPSVTAANGDAEGLPISILEAQACGVPVITSAPGAAEEIIKDGITGFAFPERDVGDLAAKLQILLTDDVLACAMAVEGPRLVAERFDIRRCTQKLEGLYNTLTSGGVSSSSPT